MIRPLQPRDLDWLRQHQNDFQWEFGPDFAGALVFTDSEDKPVMAAAGWARVEVHCVLSPDWNTPGARDAAFRELHDAMAAKMLAQGFGEAHTWFDRMETFCKRLKRLGWQEVKRKMWARRLM